MGDVLVLNMVISQITLCLYDQWVAISFKHNDNGFLNLNRVVFIRFVRP